MGNPAINALLTENQHVGPQLAAENADGSQPTHPLGCAFRIDAINGNRSHVPSPPRSGEKVAGGRMRGLTGSLSIEAEEHI